MSKKINKDSLGYLGIEYQQRLVLQILTDNKFGESIIDIIDPNYFDDPYLRIIVANIKDAKTKDDIIPNLNSLRIRVLDDMTDEIQRTYVISQLKRIEESDLNDTYFIQDRAMKFCKQQELKKSVNQIKSIIDKGDIDSYDECEMILKKALEHGEIKDDGINVLDNIETVLVDDFRNPIRTGINGLDEIMDGGLSKGELALILAPFGVGKTTMVTKIANTAVTDGKIVLQIFFEDNPKVIQRKHLACWSGIELNELSVHKNQVLKIANEKYLKNNGKLILKKFSSDGTTIPVIKKYVRKLIASGVKPDLILLDYIDCVEPSKKYDDANVGEGSVMRQFEALLDEFNMAGWTCTQGNRLSINTEVVQANQMGGSIKKGQIGHFIVSIAKTLDQKESGTATMAILKSRFGKDGIILEDIIFDNGRIQIDMGSKKAKTYSEHTSDKDKQNQARVKDLLDASNERKKLLGGLTLDNNNE